MGLPPPALPVTVAPSWALAPSTRVEVLGTLVVVLGAMVTAKHSSELVSEVLA